MLSFTVAPLWKTLRIIVALTAGLLLALYIAAAKGLGRRPAWVPRVLRWWHRKICHALGLQVEVSGAIASTALLVANHVSWLDIPVLGAQGEIAFLSKAEVRDWPVIGWMAAVADTLFIARGANQTTRLTKAIGQRIGDGQSVAIFPEGTTTDGSTPVRFHPRLFAIGQEPGIQIQPVALRYGVGPLPDPVAPFIGEDTLFAHLSRVVRHPDLLVQVRFLPPIEPGQADRRQLAEQARAAIAQALDRDPTSRSRSEIAREGGNAAANLPRTQSATATLLAE